MPLTNRISSPEAFDRLYQDEIGPMLSALEVERLAAVAQFRIHRNIGCGLSLVAGVAWFVEAGHFLLFLLPLIFGVFVTFVIAYMPLKKVGKTAKVSILDIIARVLGGSYMSEDFEPPAMPRFREIGLLPNFHTSSFEDLFECEHEGVRFSLYEAELRERQRRGSKIRWVTVFKGQLIRLAFPKKFLGTTVVRRDRGWFNPKNDSIGLKRVGLASLEFERTFEVYASDQVEARFLVHPAFMERLLELEKSLAVHDLRCAFEGGDLLIAVQGHNMFEIGDMFTSLADQARIRRIVDEIAKLAGIIDTVLADPPKPAYA